MTLKRTIRLFVQNLNPTSAKNLWNRLHFHLMTHTISIEAENILGHQVIYA